MPRVAPELEPEMMDMDEPAAPELVAPELVEPEEEDQQKEEEYEETITIRASDFVALQDTLWTSDFRYQIYREMHARIGSRPRTCCRPF
jgi:hypothetical protein